MATYYHITFGPYNKKPVLTQDIGDRFIEIVHEIADEKGFRVLAISVVPNHVHMVIEKPGEMPLAKIMQFVKGRSSRLISQQWINIAAEMGGKFWTKGYNYTLHDDKSLPVLLDYVRGQHEKHGTEPNWIKPSF